MTNAGKKIPGISNVLRVILLMCLCLVLAVNLLYSSGYAETARASDMRLLSAEGSVVVVNGSGKELSVREDMKLYSGYSVVTGESSSAYISLDDTKLVKLDAGSQVELRKDGDELELLLSSGQLLFNVTKPLAESESLNIRTSTMVTGIRGTSGYIQVLPYGNWKVSILDGKVALSAVLSGDEAALEAGKTAQSWKDTIIIDPLDPNSIPSFVLQALKEDEELRERVEEALGISTDELDGLIEEIEQKRENEQLQPLPTTSPTIVVPPPSEPPVETPLPSEEIEEEVVESPMPSEEVIESPVPSESVP